VKELAAVVKAVAEADWNKRVSLIRKVPESFGLAQHQVLYAAIAKEVYVPNLAPDFAYIHWREEYELPAVTAAYDYAHRLTAGFTSVSADDLARVIQERPTTLRVFRLLLGLTTQEFAAGTAIVAESLEVKPLTNSRVKGLEGGSPCDEETARCCAAVIDRAMRRELLPPAGGSRLRLKVEKPDTRGGWETVREYSKKGVPLPVFLHQRHYGGAFRQLSDATSSQRGDVLEDAVEVLFEENGLPYVRTGSANQEEIARRFGVTVKPAPDFVIYNGSNTPRVLLECKQANDGGTARDKASRYRALRQECARLGGIPLFAVLSGLGWKRTADALGPVVRDTDGRVFTPVTMSAMLTVQPFPNLIGTVKK
jgi:hypothetical protein